MILMCFLLPLIKQKFLLKTFLRTQNSGISSSAFPSSTNLKLHNAPVMPKLVKKVMTDLDLSKAFGPDCIPVVILKDCEPELPCIPAELFNMCLKKSSFSDC